MTANTEVKRVMYPDYLIYEDIKRKDEWEPIPLHLPLPMPMWPEDEGHTERDEDEPKHGVVIIDMEDYSECEA